MPSTEIGRRLEAGAQPPVRGLIRDAIDAIYAGQLGPITAVIAGYYLALSVSHYFFLAPDVRIPMVLVALGAAFISLITAFLAMTRRIPPALSHMALLPTAAAGITNVFLHCFLTGDQLQVTNGVMLILAFSVICLSPWIYGFLTAAAFGASVVTVLVVPGAYLVHLMFMLGGGLVLSILCFTQRYRALWQAKRLLIANREKAQILSRMNDAVKAQMHEARRAAEEARKANEAKDIFLANTSHELRTPLTGVLGMLDLLKQSPLNDDQRESVETALFSANTLLAVINDILDLAKLDAGKVTIQKHAFCPTDLVNNVVELLEPKAREKGLTLTLDLPEEQPIRALGDPVRIGQILFNLLSNAIKFTDEGTVTVRLQLAGEGDRCHLRLAVEDTGAGFDPAQAERLFERFYQLDGTARKRQGGTGLGLAICRELSDLMGGEIGIDSTPGKGSVFSFTISLPSLAAGEEVPNPKHEADIAALEGRTLSILVAEDNLVNQLLIRKLLAKYGWQLTVVDDGTKAVEAVAAGTPFDLVLMDVRMPGLDGIGATKAIRALEGRAACVPIIALTANTMKDDQAKYMAAGMNDMVGKPVQMAELLAAISRHVSAGAS